MSDNMWVPDIREGDDPLRAAVFQAVGAASMCWEEIPKSVFDSTKAKWVGDGLMAWIREKEAEHRPPIVLNMAQEIYTREDADVEAPRTFGQDLAQVLNRHGT